MDLEGNLTVFGAISVFQMVNIAQGTGELTLDNGPNSARIYFEKGDLVFAELPVVGDEISQGDPCAVVESVKAASDIYAPVSGKVIAINEDLDADPPYRVCVKRSRRDGTLCSRTTSTRCARCRAPGARAAARCCSCPYMVCPHTDWPRVRADRPGS